MSKHLIYPYFGLWQVPIEHLPQHVHEAKYLQVPHVARWSSVP